MIPDTFVTKHLGTNSIGSVIKATLFGVPLPVCSCGVIPLATSIHKSGASKGSTLSFLISTPITGVDSILVTYGIFGWICTIYRIMTSMMIAMIAGILTNLFDKENAIVPEEKSSSCCSSTCCGNTSEEKKVFHFTKLYATLLSHCWETLPSLFFGD